MLSFKIKKINEEIPSNVQLIAVSKTKTEEEILEIYKTGHRNFGENKAIEVKEKFNNLPKDILWHFIGHLQTNKIKYIAPFISLIHSVDSFKLLSEINKFAVKNKRTIPCLLQFHIATEETKFGFNLSEVELMLKSKEYFELKNIEIQGVMGMASFTENFNLVREEFQNLNKIFTFLKENYFLDKINFKEISMGMSHDYKIAIEQGSTIVRIGSAIFGDRL